ncbi:TRAP transporter small permease subunit [Pseudoflavonifractor sp. BIOML-A6]|nr:MULTISPECIES: TRAP transporter small permease [unclassified Pseudoflavonifractor]MTQ97516.1 TRAP transporter small permease subunit [Pseudoflavonifractor sp. BIOML-A16]MTR06522.1 TRAP transporter small permease subunit [Pseudoflavonifractor sp. BIOML-A15]MTR31903.1 TRAP transporter small permease subunit [Pseudoflavonifractor sp. BIOML-A14]MTR74109.1 TRAP transporter small permease subunit [Pseudoflavonifractor sp. BIOML-A18]MTS64454.1 TRAP transporter small permease subunit [Pseudoflavonif
MNILKKTENAVGKFSRAVASICLGIVFVLFLLNICTRIPFIKWNPVWIDETIQFFLVWMIFLAAMELVRVGGHFMVDILTDKVHGTLVGRIFRILSTVISLITYGVIFYFGVQLCLRSTASLFTLQFMKKSYFYACIPFSAFFMSLFTLRDVVLAFMDLFTGGRITEKQDAEKAAQAAGDEDAQAIAEAAAALAADEAAQKPETDK